MGTINIDVNIDDVLNAPNARTPNLEFGFGKSSRHYNTDSVVSAAAVAGNSFNQTCYTEFCRKHMTRLVPLVHKVYPKVREGIVGNDILPDFVTMIFIMKQLCDSLMAMNVLSNTYNVTTGKNVPSRCAVAYAILDKLDNLTSLKDAVTSGATVKSNKGRIDGFTYMSGENIAKTKVTAKAKRYSKTKGKNGGKGSKGRQYVKKSDYFTIPYFIYTICVVIDEVCMLDRLPSAKKGSLTAGNSGAGTGEVSPSG